MNDIAKTTYSGCRCNKLVNTPNVFLDDVDIKNSAIQIIENINDQKLTFNFIVLSLKYFSIGFCTYEVNPSHLQWRFF